VDLVRHLETYRTSLRKDALTGCAEYSKNLPTDDYPSVFNYLSEALRNAQAAAEAGDHHNYRTWVSRHRDGTVALFERMVQEALWDYEDVSAEHIHQMVNDRGWPWYKFCKRWLDMTMRMTLDGAEQSVRMVWLPRYTREFTDGWFWKDRVVFDADELGWLMTAGNTPKDTGPVVKFKLDNPQQKFVKVEGGAVFYKPLLKVNEGAEIVDWTLRLF
jgi:hypothetical protein